MADLCQRSTKANCLELFSANLQKEREWCICWKAVEACDGVIHGLAAAFSMEETASHETHVLGFCVQQLEKHDD